MKKHRKFLKDLQTSEQFYNDQESRQIIGELIAMIDEGYNMQPKADWIPCEERLPELDEGTKYFKQSKCVLVAIEWWDGEITEEVGWCNKGGVWNYDSKNCKVIAWQPLPQPYKKEGAENDR